MDIFYSVVFDTVGWVTGRASGMEKPATVILKGSVLEDPAWMYSQYDCLGFCLL